MTASRDHRCAADAVQLHAGQTVRVTITKGRSQDRGSFTTTAAEHPDVPGLLTGTAGDRELVLQRPNGDQPYPVQVVS